MADFLFDNGIHVQSIHGDLDQNERRKTLTLFSNRSLSVLTATDVAARGIDIKDLEAVINYDLPMDPEDYVHRVGRTGRAGSKGLAFSLFVKQEESKVYDIQELVKKDFKIQRLENVDNFEKYIASPPMDTIFISGGKKDKLRPGDVLGALVKEAGLEPNEVGDITILPIITYVAIKKEKVEQAIEKLTNGKIKNRKFRVGLS